MIRFYSPPDSQNEVLDRLVPRQQDRPEAEAIAAETVLPPEPPDVSAPD